MIYENYLILVLFKLKIWAFLITKIVFNKVEFDRWDLYLLLFHSLVKNKADRALKAKYLVILSEEMKVVSQIFGNML